MRNAYGLQKIKIVKPLGPSLCSESKIYISCVFNLIEIEYID